MQHRGVVADLLLGQRHEAPVLLPGRVVDLDEAADLGLEVLLAERAHDDAVTLLQLVGELPDHRVDPVAPGDVQLPHQQVHRLGHAGALEQLRVVAVRPGREDQRRALVALGQHAALVVHREVGRADHPVAALPAQPLLGAVEQRAGGLGVLLALEEAEPTPAVAPGSAGSCRRPARLSARPAARRAARGSTRRGRARRTGSCAGRGTACARRPAARPSSARRGRARTGVG